MHAYQDAARNAAIRALNSAVTWDEHPSYDTKTDVLHRLTLAQGALGVIQEAENIPNVYDDGSCIVAGVDLLAMLEVVYLVKNRKGTTNGGIRYAVRRALFPVHATA